MKRFLVATELGLILLDDNYAPVSKLEFPASDRTRKFLDASSGVLGEGELRWIREQLRSEDTLFAELPTVQALSSAGGVMSQRIPEADQKEVERRKVELIVASGLSATREQVEETLREVSMAVSSLKIKELSSNPDLQAMEAVQGLDEIDKTANILSARIREWYGLHFPELTSWIDDNLALVKLVLKFQSREHFDAEELEAMGYSKNKSRAIADAAKQSRGADLRTEDLARILQLAEEAQHLYSLRDKLASHVERTMRQVAPNVSEVAGPSIGARLIARAGGLRKLAVMPASTIQILGAEKALYRALKSGARPPKHGILFQHEAVHSAPKWQRGKIARSVAGKIAIAARVDSFRGERDESVLNSLRARLEEIKEKYKEAPKESPRRAEEGREFRPPQRDFDRREGGRKFRHGKKRREDRKGGKQGRYGPRAA